jgi:branched-subunit amino acid aminotransferase/4-amino-4-deoxychorismate lyase
MSPSAPTERLSLLESLRFEPGLGFYLLEAHLDRLAAAALHFGYPFDRETVRRVLCDHAASVDGAHKVRVLVAPDGAVHVATEPIVPSRQPLRVVLARHPIDVKDPTLRFKTTRRVVYDDALREARSSHPGVDDVLLWSAAGEVTEASSSNIVLQRDQEFLTPPVSVGLLCGTFRASLLARGVLREAPLRVSDLRPSDRLYLINSVRGWRRAIYEIRTD